MPRGRPHPPSSSPPHFESEVRANILSQPLSPAQDLGTIADLDLPHDFLSRLADRALRASFYERFRAVTGDAPPFSPPESPRAATPNTSSQIHIEHLPLPPNIASLWRSLPEAPPPLANFRSPLTTNDPAPSAHADALPAAQRTARKHLARDGLLPALAHTIAALDPHRLLPPHTDAPALLTEAGIPIDLLSFLQPAFLPESATPAHIIAALASRLAAGESLDKLLKSLRKPRFTPRPSNPDLHLSSDSGSTPITLLRAHASRTTYFSAPGDGSNLDLLSATLAALPDTPALITTSEEHALALQTALTSLPRSAPTTILAQPLTPSQWAGDNAKPGTLNRRPAHLVPRFASRAEYHPIFISGDDLALRASESHIPTIRSPLLFQGGNLLLIDDLHAAKRILLIGEAEIHRNRALGLSRDQILDFFRIEFAADLCEVLPAASYHIDQELTIRSAPHRTLAFIPDILPAAKLIVETALTKLRDSSRWPASLIDESLAALRTPTPTPTPPNIPRALNLIWSALARERTPDGGWPILFSDLFSTGPADSGVGNLHRFLLALDHLAADALPPTSIADPNLAALLRSLRRRADDRTRIRTLLSRLGWTIIPIPALPEDARGLNPLNGLHTPTSYLLPTYGGLFTPLDRLAQSAFAAALGPSIHLIPVPTAESQRREGAIHCSIAAYSASNQARPTPSPGCG